MTNLFILILSTTLLQSVFGLGQNQYVYDNETIVSDIPINDDSPCTRTCKVGGKSMVCHYKFVVEWYHTLSRACHDCPNNSTDCLRPHCVFGDGSFRAVLVANRAMPGPRIQVCYGDRVIVDVENRLQSEETTIHWHGHHQRKTPYSDGVPYVTQCPIASGTTFRYAFDAVQTGTYWWHSHSGTQRGDGLYGALVIRQPKNKDPQRKRYDYDLPNHLMLITEWITNTDEPWYAATIYSGFDIPVHSLLVNGLGYIVNQNSTNNIMPPRFTVKKGYRYRFRIVNTEFLICPIEVSVDNHTMTVIATDGFDIQPVTVNSLVTYSGERFDIVINANKKIDHYWIRFRGLLMCGANRAHQVAVLSYEGVREANALPKEVPTYDRSHQDGLQLNPLNENLWSNTTIAIPTLKALAEPDASLREQPDVKYYVHYDFYNISNPNYYVKGLYDYNQNDPKSRMRTPQFNHITFKMPSIAVLPMRDSLTPDMFCNESTVTNCTKEFCHCTHVIQVPLNAVVEMIMVDIGKAQDTNHPFHLHGHSFRVVGMEKLGPSTSIELIQEMDRNGLLKRNLKNPPIKDTVNVPDGGYTIMRWHANNPGYWIFHCHIEFHVSFGMIIVFKVGENDDMVPVPDKFPTCGNWLPDE